MKMSAPAIVKTVLIVDEDLGFVFWLGRLLNETGYQAWPARSGIEAEALLSEIDVHPDLLVINPNSEGAAAFVKDQRRRADFKTIAINAPDAQPQAAAPIEGIDAALVKPGRHNDLNAFEWTSVIDSLMMKWVH
jgi:response regulator RpfG family c-di-GMP phosphodiesterase